MRLFISSILITALFASCSSVKDIPGVNTTVLPMGEDVRLYAGTVVYSLPLTAFDFTVIAEKRVFKAGPYNKFADQFLGIRDVITEDKIVWELREVGIRPLLEVDPDQYYIIETDGLIQTNALALKAAGLILDISPEYHNEGDYTGDINSESGIYQFRDMGSDEYFNIEQDTTYKLIELDTAFVRIPYVLERKRKLTLEEQAENAARILLELREGRHMILTGEANVFPQDRAAIDEINRLENEYIALFTGKTTREIKKFRFFLVPQKEMIGKPTVICRFSPETGVVDSQDISGRPVVVEMISAGKVKDLKMIARDIDPEIVKYDKLYYRIPEVVNVRVTDGRKNLGNSRLLIYQFGPIVTLPANYIIGK